MRFFRLAPLITRRFLALLAGAGVLAAPMPAHALEEVLLRLPLLDTGFRVKLSELEDPIRLLSGTSDLAELDRAVDGVLGRKLIELFQTPLPVQTTAILEESVGSEMLEQALLALSSVARVEGLPVDLEGTQGLDALRRAAATGNVTLLSFLQALPGQSASIDLQRALTALSRTRAQQRRADAIVTAGPAAASDPVLASLGGRATRRLDLSVSVPHRPEPLQVVVIRPDAQANGRLVVISHGLWDGPESFEGWATHLASHGYTVLLPRHPGSDSSQQQAMLSGQMPPPSPTELRMRPLDVSGVLDAGQSERIPELAGLRFDQVVVLGHSWGATTALQLGGVQPSSAQLRGRCSDLYDPDRNISWVLQCSFIDTADRAGLGDRRVIAVAAVSPPLSLLFDLGSGTQMNARGLLVTGSRDWVVPSGPEALSRFSAPARQGHQLVVAGNGDHFNLRAPAGGQGGPLRALLLAWANSSFTAGPAVLPTPGAAPLLSPTGWGVPEMKLVLTNLAGR